MPSPGIALSNTFGFRMRSPDVVTPDQCFIVSRIFDPVGQVGPFAVPDGCAAHVLLVGPFDGLPAAWRRLFDWADSERLKRAGVNWEID